MAYSEYSSQMNERMRQTPEGEKTYQQHQAVMKRIKGFPKEIIGKVIGGAKKIGGAIKRRLSKLK